jgi:hypothetical protein
MSSGDPNSENRASPKRPKTLPTLPDLNKPKLSADDARPKPPPIPIRSAHRKSENRASPKRPKTLPTLPDLNKPKPSALNLGPVRSPRHASGADGHPVFIATDKPSAMRLSPVDVPPSEAPAVAPSRAMLFGRFFAVTFLVAAVVSALALLALSRSSRFAPPPASTSVTSPNANTMAIKGRLPSIHLAGDTVTSEVPPAVTPSHAATSQPSPQSSATPRATRPRSAHKPQSLDEVPDELPY